MDDLATWLRATLDAIESDAKSYWELQLDWPDWPTLVLAQVGATRQILELHQRCDARPDWFGREAPGRPGWAEPACYGCHADFQEEYYEPDANNCAVARLLALPFADQPGYRDEWRPRPAE